MKKQKTISNPLPKNTVTKKNDRYFFDGKLIDIEILDQLVSESEVFKKTLLYKMWQGYVRTEAMTAIIQDSKDFRDVENGKALLIALDKLDNMMSDLVEQHDKIVKNKQ